MSQDKFRKFRRRSIASASVLALAASMLTVSATGSSASELPPIDVVPNEIGVSGQTVDRDDYGWTNDIGEKKGSAKIVYNNTDGFDNFDSLLEMQVANTSEIAHFFHFFQSGKYPSIDDDAKSGWDPGGAASRPVGDFAGKEMSTTVKSQAGVVTFQLELFIKEEGKDAQWIGTLRQNRDASTKEFTKVSANLDGTGPDQSKKDKWYIQRGQADTKKPATYGGALNEALGRDERFFGCDPSWCYFTLQELNELTTHVFGFGLNRGTGEEANLDQIKDITFLGQKFRFLTQRIDATDVGSKNLSDGTVSGYATATSELPVSVTSQTSEVCAQTSSTGDEIKLKSAGTCTVVVSQGGDGASFGAAPDVTMSFKVVGETPKPKPDPIADKCKGGSCRGADLGGEDLSDRNLAGVDLNNANLKNANLGNANLKNANLKNANLGNANLKNANLGNANLNNANLGKANLNNANLRKANLNNANLSVANLRNANFVRAKLAKAVLSRANFTRANLSRADLRGARTKTSSTRGEATGKRRYVAPTRYSIILARANLSRARMSGAQLRNASLVRTNLKRANLAKANLRHANLAKANAVRANLKRANLRAANLRGAKLRQAKLQGANKVGIYR